MPTFTNTIPAPELDGVVPFIEARHPGEPLGIQTSATKVLEIDMPTLTTVQFDTLIADLQAAFPSAMFPDNDHDLPLAITDAAAMVWTSMPAALTEFRGLTIHRACAFLSSKTQAQLTANVTVAGAAGAGLRVQASLDNGANWRSLEAGAGVGPQVSISATGVIKGPPINIDAAVRKDVLLRVVGGGGNGTISPQFGTILLRVR